MPPGRRRPDEAPDTAWRSDTLFCTDAVVAVGQPADEGTTRRRAAREAVAHRAVIAADQPTDSLRARDRHTGVARLNGADVEPDQPADGDAFCRHRPGRVARLHRADIVSDQRTHGVGVEIGLDVDADEADVGDRAAVAEDADQSDIVVGGGQRDGEVADGVTEAIELAGKSARAGLPEQRVAVGRVAGIDIGGERVVAGEAACLRVDRVDRGRATPSMPSTSAIV